MCYSKATARCRALLKLHYASCGGAAPSSAFLHAVHVLVSATPHEMIQASGTSCSNATTTCIPFVTKLCSATYVSSI